MGRDAVSCGLEFKGTSSMPPSAQVLRNSSSKSCVKVAGQLMEKPPCNAHRTLVGICDVGGGTQ